MELHWLLKAWAFDFVSSTRRLYCVSVSVDRFLKRSFRLYTADVHFGAEPVYWHQFALHAALAHDGQRFLLGLQWLVLIGISAWVVLGFQRDLFGERCPLSIHRCILRNKVERLLVSTYIFFACSFFFPKPIGRIRPRPADDFHPFFFYRC